MSALSVENTDISSNKSASRPITIKDKRLQSLQKTVALITISIPVLGTICAIALAIWIGFNPLSLALLFIFYTLTYLGGITVGLHRYFAHRTFSTYPAIQVILAVLGAMAAQGPIVPWVSNHRRHHQFSDQSGDPHSPHAHGRLSEDFLKAVFYAHIGWMFSGEITNASLFAKDLLRDPLVRFVNKYYWLWVILGLVLPAMLEGVLTVSWQGALQGFLWGGLVRIFLVHQATWCINSVTHLWGNRPFRTVEKSVNNFWLAIPTVGESWHNNHHAFPNSSYFGLFWWQADPGGWLIRCLAGIGWVWDVKCPTQEMILGKSTLLPSSPTKSH